MISGPRQPIVAPADLTRFFVAFGLPPLLLARMDVALADPPWSFALTPTWSLGQLVFVALAGVILGVTSGRPAQGLAAVAMGVLFGLAVDLWWLAGEVKPFDQTYVSMLSPAEWQSRLTLSAVALLGAISGGFLVGVVVRRLSRDNPRRSLERPSATEAVAIGLAVIAGPLLAVGIAAALSSSALVVADDAQVQTIRVSAGAITVDPAVLRPGPTWFRCLFAADATSEWARIVALPESGEIEYPAVEDYASCGFEPGSATWGRTITELQPGRYVWAQIDVQSEPPRTIVKSPVVVVAP